MRVSPAVFRAYDIRGSNSEITAEFMTHLGRAFVATFNAREVVVGYDARPTSKEFLPYFLKGVTGQGADVRLVGLVPGELVIAAAAGAKIKNAAILTASHNPAEYLGIKLYKDSSVQIAVDDGQAEIKRMVEEENYPEAGRSGQIRSFDPWPGYLSHILSVLKLPPLRKRRALVDAGNGTGGMIINRLSGKFNLAVERMYFELDGTYPHHVPNPVVPAFRREAERRARQGNFDLTILFDGDADRVIFLDENGNYVPSDFSGTLIVEEIFQKRLPGSPAVTDLKRGRTLQESGRRHSYPANVVRTGNPFLKREMRRLKAPFGFEGSAHNIFRDFFYSESSALTIGYVLMILEKTGQSLSQLVAPFRQTNFMIEETNYRHHRAKTAFTALEKHYPAAKITHTDGLSIIYPEWHLNLRSSNTEPLIRFNIEGRDKATVEAQFTAVDKIIVSTGGQRLDH